jgi:glyoxylase-like metal-dependent hydrolase (beta-lactamase superfamily II)
MDDLIEIDTMTGGMSGVTAGYLVPAPRPVLLECGPARSIEHTIAGLRAIGLDPDDLAYLVVSHVHLDHAGGAGDLARAFPNATVVVSELGARHLVDPTRLNDSAQRVYGEFYDRVYGPSSPIAEDRVLGVADGHRLDLGGGRSLELLWTPGHAKHHLGVLDHDSGALFTGDSVGVKLAGMRVIRPATPPADFQFETSLATLARYRTLDPTRLYLAHYGPVDPPHDALAEAEDRLRAWMATAEEAYREAPEVDHIADLLTHRFRDELEPVVGDAVGSDAAEPDIDATEGAEGDVGGAGVVGDTARRLELLNGVRSNAAGMLRYLERRDAGTLTPIG